MRDDIQRPCAKIRKVFSSQYWSKHFRSFSDSFVNIFGGELALERRKKARTVIKDPKISASPISGNGMVPF